MAGFAFAFQVIYWRFMPHLLMISIQLGYAFLYFITEAAFNHGLNPSVYVTYRCIVGGMVMFPFAYFLERKLRPKLTLALLLEICVLSLLGASLTINMYLASLRYTSPTFVTSVINTIPAMTFVVAVILRLEVIDIKNRRGRATILGTLLSLAGVMTVTLYKGPQLQSLQGAPFHIRSNPAQKNWMMGSLLVVASCILWSIYFILQMHALILQTYTLKRYPAPLSLTAWISCLGGAQSAIITLFMQHELAAWSITLNIELWSIIYSGVTSCGLAILVQLWCTKLKGPVFVTMFSSLSAVMVAILAYFLFGEELPMGSIVGGATVIIGLYLLLYGKEGDQDQKKSIEQTFPTCDEEREQQVEMEVSARR